MSRSGRIVGMIVFVAGIGILLFVLVTAYQMFTSPASEVLAGTGEAADGPGAAGLGAALGWVLVRVALLFVMTLAASLIASRGIQLYLGSAAEKTSSA